MPQRFIPLQVIRNLRRPWQRLGSICALVLALAWTSAVAGTVSERTLDSAWEFRQLPTAAAPSQAAPIEAGPIEAMQWHPAKLPGTVHTDLFDNGLIADPYVGMPEAGLQWIGLADWEYRTQFEVSPDVRGMARSDLVFEGLDTFAEVFLNGEKVLDADNAFRTWRVPVQGHLRDGSNELRVVLRSPIYRLLPQVQAMPQRIAGNYPSPYGDEPKEAMTANFVRKPGYHYGWDWGPRYVTAGLWRPVRLLSWDRSRIEDLQLRQDRVTADLAKVTAVATVDAVSAGDYVLRLWQSSPEGPRKLVATRRVSLAAGLNHLSQPLRIERPQRWFPVGYGAQPLYRFELELLDGAQVVDS